MIDAHIGKEQGLPMIQMINATVLFVRDLARCLTFYQDMLGLQVQLRDPVSVGFRMGDHHFILLEVSAAVDMISEETVAPQTEGGHRVLLCAFVDNVDASYAALSAKGIAFIHPPTNQPWGRRTAYFADPEGNLWEISHALAVKQEG
jgi:lactoylglutathione lyase